MSNNQVHAFFVGRAIAEALYEQLEQALTNAVSEFGKFDAEQRERLREFTLQAIERANRSQESTMQGRTTAPTGQGTRYADETLGLGSPSGDLQATIDELRAEIAQMRSELQRYRSRSV
ncbi:MULTISPECIES: DUF6825 family protein [Aerosakkonema]|uniref:DUF6825 family protein n=1 Tax=Aerosakkonema TaxID=1246629 RepID=UPI0035BB0B3A